MDSIILNIIFAVFMFWLGYNYAKLKFLYRISERPEEMMDILTKIKKINDEEKVGAPPESIWVQTEEAQGYFYLYDKNTNQFLGQGKTVADALKMASDRFPGKTFWLPKINLDSQSA